MPDRPGELLRMLLPIAHLNVNIIDVDVNRLDARPRMGERIVELCVAITGQAQADSLLTALRAKGYHVLVSRWQDPRVDRSGNLSRSLINTDRARDPHAQEATNA
jgi:ACT domain-containing protein